MADQAVTGRDAGKSAAAQSPRRWGCARLVRRRAARPLGDRGSAIIELAIVTPVVIVLLFTMVALGRYSNSKILVEQASAAAARAASLTSSPGQAQRAAQSAAQDTLSGAGLSCARMTASVDTSAFRPGGQVSVSVTCSADLSQLALTGVPGSASLSSTSVAPLEAFRSLTVGR
jgi:Flp pilus assembly protein TadG